MCNNFIVEDLRGKKNAPADIRIVFHSGIIIRSKFALLLTIDAETNEASICGFESNYFMTDLVIPKNVMSYTITSIKENAFKLCPNLRTVIIPDTVTTIEDYAFYECVSMTSITIPNSVTKIGKFAFKKCYALKTIFADDPSIMEMIEASEKVVIDNQYIDKLIQLFEQNRDKPEDKPNNPEIVKLSHSIAFSPVICEFADGIAKIEDVRDFNNVLLKSMLKNQSVLNACGFGFVKYLHIYNHVSLNNIGYINIYVDYSNNTISLDRGTDGASNKVFDDKSLIYLAKTKNNLGIMGGGIVEYCNNSDNGILDPDYYPVVSLDKNHHCQPSEFLKQWFQLNEKDWDKATADLIALEGFIKENKSITNVFYIGNYREDLDRDDLDRDYPLWANVGIDCSDFKNKGCIKAYLEQLRNFLHRISVQIQFGTKRLELRETAARSAVGQVNSRNFSHNFGSHVFSKLMGNDTYENIEKLASNNAYVSCYDKMGIEPGEQLACFLQYVKSRMDYLSELTFGVSNILTSKTIHGDVFRELDRVRLLLNHISGVSSFKYEFCLKYNGERLGEGRDITVAFPSDVLGSQALYNILENIIRNTAKHAIRNEANSGCEAFTIEFSDGELFPEYYCVEIDNGIAEPNIEELVNKQNEYINNSILDDSNNLRTYSLGLLEIEASAAFLRQIDIAKIESYEYGFGEDDIDEYHNNLGNLIILKAINKNGALGYRFFLQKPKEFLFVGDNWGINPNQKALFNYGLLIVGADQFVQDMNSGKSYAHQFLVYNDSITKEAEEMLSNNNVCKTLLPIRKLKFNHEETLEVTDMFMKADKDNPIPGLKELAWNHYYKTVIDPSNSEICIDAKIEADDDSETIRNQVVFLDHGKKNNHEKKWDKAQNCQKVEAWVENLSSHSCAKLPEFQALSVGEYKPIHNYIMKIKEAKQIKQEIFEAYHNPIVVIDERIQEHQSKGFEGSSDAEFGGPIPVKKLYESTNVHVPDVSSIPLAPKKFDNSLIEKVEDFIETNIQNAFVLIHYGVLERMYEKDEVITQKLNDWSCKAKRLVVTSGRGSHSLALPPSVCFVDLSSVLYAFVENRNKYIINYLLHQARRKNG